LPLLGVMCVSCTGVMHPASLESVTPQVQLVQVVSNELLPSTPYPCLGPAGA
jgi:hypothetical protein